MYTSTNVPKILRNKFTPLNSSKIAQVAKATVPTAEIIELAAWFLTTIFTRIDTNQIISGTFGNWATTKWPFLSKKSFL